MSFIRDRLADKAAAKQVPIMCAFELLPVCNLNCKMCYVRKSMSEVQMAGGLKDANWWLNLARQARDAGLLYPLLTGGEPFLHPEFFDILAGMTEMGLQVSINSNGTLIDEAKAKLLAKYRPIRINITLYGASERAYEDLCGDADAFRRMKQGVALLKRYDVPIKFNASITPENVSDLEGIVAFAKEQGCPIQIATYMFPPIRRDESMIGQNARLSPEDAALARVRADFLQNEPQWFLGQAARFSKFIPIDQIDFGNKEGKEMGMQCRAGLCSFWIDWQGKLMNCGMYPSVRLDPETMPFDKAWKELVEHTAQVRYSPDCILCPNRWLCHPCIAMVSNECGDLNGRPEYLCRMNQASAHYYSEFVAKYFPDSKIQPDLNLPQTDMCEI